MNRWYLIEVESSGYTVRRTCSTHQDAVEAGKMELEKDPGSMFIIAEAMSTIKSGVVVARIE